MRYSDNVIEDVKDGNDIIDLIGSYVHLKRSGNNYMGLCPFHGEKSPSFNVNPNRQLYHCFGCGASGTVFNFIQAIENLNFLEALNFLADRINYTLPTNSTNQYAFEEANNKKAILYDIHKVVARKYYDNLSTPEGNIANIYLDERKIKKNIRIKYGLGYALKNSKEIYTFLKSRGYEDNTILDSGLVIKSNSGDFFDRFSGRVMFPIIDVRGRVIAFGGREILGKENSPKYLNSSDTSIFNKSLNLYSLNFAKNTSNKELILVEGYMDVIALYQAGIYNAVASLGTAFNDSHISILKKYASKVIILFDSDDAGIKATERAIPLLVKNNIYTRVAQVTEAKDPDEYIQKWGANNFVGLLNNAKSYIMFEIEQLEKLYNLDIPTQKVEFLTETSKIISRLSSPIEREIFIKETSRITGVDYKILEEEINLILPNVNPIQKSQIKRNRANQQHKPQNNHKLNEAIISILFMLFSDLNIHDKLAPHINPENFMSQPYIKVAEIILNDKEKLLQPSDIVLKFTDEQEQNLVSKIFIPKINFFENFIEYPEFEKILNNQFKIIKNSYYKKTLIQLSDTDTSEEQLKIILEQKKYYENFYIKL